MRETATGDGRPARFRAAYAAHARDVLAYALRRVRVAEDAADVVAETFLVAWRRVDELPPDDEVRLWLYGVARHVLANHDRSAVRRHRLGERLRGELALRYAVPDPADEVADAAAVRQVLDGLPELDREVLTLSVWEGLAPREVAVVLGVDATVVRARLARARGRLRDLIGHDRAGAGHAGVVSTVPAGEEER